MDDKIQVTDSVKKIFNFLKPLLMQTDPSNPEDLQKLAVFLFNNYLTNGWADDVVEVLIQASIYTSWENFYLNYLCADISEYKHHMHILPFIGGFDLNPVKAMWEHFNSSEFLRGETVQERQEHLRLTDHPDGRIINAMCKKLSTETLTRAFSTLSVTKIKKLFTDACNYRGINAAEFLKFFGDKTGVITPTVNPAPANTAPSTNNTASANNASGSVPTTRNYSPRAAAVAFKHISDAIKFKEPGKVENGLNSFAWKSTLTLTPFRYKQLFRSEPKLKHIIQKALAKKNINVQINAAFISLQDPEVLLIATPGYNFLTTRFLLKNDLNISLVGI